jgi:rhomboid protease GluP
MTDHRPRFAPALAGLTAAASMSASLHICGSLFSTVTSSQLLGIGAIDGRKLAAGEWWRLLTCQLLHVRPAHMAFNVVTILFIGWALERAIGSARVAAIYLVSGTAGVVASLLFSPEQVSSGASQALMGLAAGALLILRRGYRSPRWLPAIAVATLGIQLALDLLVAHYPKPGHVGGFLAGLLLAATLVRRQGPAGPALETGVPGAAGPK